MRTLTAAQTTALQAADRATHFRVDIEDPDGVMVNVTDFDGTGQFDFLDQIVIEANVDNPISSVTVTLKRAVDGVSIAPLIEGSELNVDSGGSYAPFIDVSRRIDVYVATLEPGQLLTASDWVLIWEGYIDDPEWGGRPSRPIELRGRDPMREFANTIIQTQTNYGGGSPLAEIDAVMQSILDDHMGSGLYTLTVVGDPDFGIYEYPLANVSVLDALNALRNLQGWNLHWRWDEALSPDAFAPTYYEPVRNAATLSGYTPDWTFSADDYYEVHSVRLDSAGIRNVGELVYTDTSGADQTVTDTRSTSVAKYGTRFIRLDERGNSVKTSAQATALLTAVLDDLEDPRATQEIEAAFFWPIELGDMYRYTANDVHYDVDQDWAVVGYRHVLSQNQRRTYITAAGKPSGGYTRWHRKEAAGAPVKPAVPSIETTFDANGQAVVTAIGDADTERMYITVGDGTAPDDPTPTVNDGTITGRSGTASSGVKVTTGNDAYVKAIAVNRGSFGAVATARFARNLGPFHKDTSTRTVTGTTVETTLETITVPANVLGIDGVLEVDVLIDFSGTNDAKTVRIDWNGTTRYTLAVGATYVSDVLIRMRLMNNGSASSQVIYGFTIYQVADSGTEVEVFRANATEDTSGDLDIDVTGQLVNTADAINVVVTTAEYKGTN